MFPLNVSSSEPDPWLEKPPAAAAFARSCLKLLVKSPERAAAAAADCHRLPPGGGELPSPRLERLRELLLGVAVLTGTPAAAAAAAAASPRFGSPARLNLDAHMRGRRLAVLTSISEILLF